MQSMNTIIATACLLYTSDTGNLVSVEDELENVENYFKIQQYRFGDKLDMRVNFPDDYARIDVYKRQPLWSAVESDAICKVCCYE